MGLLSNLIGEGKNGISKHEAESREVQILRNAHKLERSQDGILQGESCRDSGKQNQRNHAGLREVYDASDSRLEGAAVPCSGCGSCLYWFDRYGGGPHCHRCRDWPSYAVVARIAAVVAGPDGTTSWLTLWPRDESEAVQEAPDASCPHRRSRKRVVWPAADRGNILVADLERWQESEEFNECLACGEWILESEIGN